MVDQLRMVAIAEPGDPPPSPIVLEHKKAGFVKILDYYFKGVEGFIQTKGDHRQPGTNRLALGRQKAVIDCPYPGASFGEGGVLHRIGTDHGRRAWVNPHTDGEVVAAMSSVGHNGPPHKFVGRSDDGYCCTSAVANSWMSVDLGATRTVVTTHYCLRNSAGSAPVRNWSLEGRAADAGAEDWQEIRRHDNDETLAQYEKYAVGAWPVDAGGRAFRHLRIRQHGWNAIGDGRLYCCGFEVYGALLDAGGVRRETHCSTT